MSFGVVSPDSLIGREIAGYEITAFIASGAASLVFRGKRVADTPATTEITDQTGTLPLAVPEVAAIKLLSPSLGATEKELADFQRRFAREADVLKQLAHPHILTVIASGKDADTGSFYMILPYMEGGSLASALARRGPLPLPEAATILAQLADALDYAHAQGVIHRDVKPGNILLDAQGAPYLSDFGIVRFLSNSATERTTIGRVIGSPAYMAPEQFSDPGRVGPLSDTYSLGMVVHQMVTGHVAFEATSWPALIHQQLNEIPPSPRGARPDLPEPAAAAILKTLEKDPALRFPSAAAFAQAFALGLHGQWADGLMEYMASATMPATTIIEPLTPIAPAAAPMAYERIDLSAAPTWPNDAMMNDQPGAHRGGRRRLGVRGVVAAAAALLLVSSLVGLVYLGASGSAQPPSSQDASNAGAGSKTEQTLPAATNTPTSTPTRMPTSTPTHTPTSTPTSAPTSTPTREPTPTQAPTSTPTDTPTDTPTPTQTPTSTPTDTPTPTATNTTGGGDGGGETSSYQQQASRASQRPIVYPAPYAFQHPALHQSRHTSQRPNRHHARHTSHH